MKSSPAQTSIYTKGVVGEKKKGKPNELDIG